RQCRSNPEIAFFKLWQEFETKKPDGHNGDAEKQSRTQKCPSPFAYRELKNGVVDPAHHSHKPCLDFLDALGAEKGCQCRCYRTGCSQASGDCVRICFRHWAEDVTFNAA